ncbi:MAG: hypothetical protein M1572_08920 [Gammaproteobacteria bacterium]|nr:hypothetical protein [Gammaproteobacteria bacterium]HQR83134.1 hypothetical protein [Thiotrichales bacterium]
MNDSKVKVFLTRYDLFQKGIIECDAVIVNDVARVNLDGKEINVSEQGRNYHLSLDAAVNYAENLRRETISHLLLTINELTIFPILPSEIDELTYLKNRIQELEQQYGMGRINKVGFI